MATPGPRDTQAYPPPLAGYELDHADDEMFAAPAEERVQESDPWNTLAVAELEAALPAQQQQQQQQ